MHKDLLLYIGAGLMFGSMALGLALGLIHLTTRPMPLTHFKYGTFYTVFALTGSMGLCFAFACFFFLYLHPDLAICLTIFMLGFLVGLILVVFRVKKDNRILFAVLSFYALFSFYLAPLFLWNLIYLFFLAKKPPAPPPVPPLPQQV